MQLAVKIEKMSSQSSKEGGMRGNLRLFGLKRMSAAGAALLLAQVSFAAAIIEGERMTPVPGREGMVVTSHFLATESALDVLENGGNAIDAAVTAAFSLAVTQPRSGNIGGGGFMLISSEKTGEVVAIDYREKAPRKASVDMFLNKDGDADSVLSRYSHLASGVPGTVAGLALALEKYGTISLADALAPAIKLAEDGFTVSCLCRRILPRRSNVSLNPERLNFIKAGPLSCWLPRWPGTVG
jgi:gamma-glutamyltranspeptidase